jgi:hypothetical protein
MFGFRFDRSIRERRHGLRPLFESAARTSHISPHGRICSATPPMRPFSPISYHFLAKDAVPAEQGGFCLVFVGFIAICGNGIARTHFE